jgi:hypothetical protein
MGERKCLYRVLVGRPEGKRPLGRPMHRLKDNIKMDHREVGCRVMDWIDVVWYRDRWRAFANAIVNLRFPLNAGNFLIS